MTPYFLLQALGDIDSELVERAAQTPLRVRPLPWVAAVAVAAVMVTALGIWWFNGRSPDTPSVTPPSITTTDGTTTMNKTTTTTNTTESSTTTTTHPDDGTGGDQWSCPVHSLDYHTIGLGGRGAAYNETAMVQAFLASLPESSAPDRTYPYECHYPESNIVNFVRFCGITREQYIEVMGWENVLDEIYTYVPSFVGEPSYHLFTFGQLVDAIFGDDPHLSAWVFDHNASYLYERGREGLYQYYYFVTYDPSFPDPLVEYVKKKEGWDRNFSYRGTIVELVQEFHITREEFITAYGWEEKLDEKATDHFAYAPYTYRQFVDAVYGNDEALRSWVFDQCVFHPDYPPYSE